MGASGALGETHKCLIFEDAFVAATADVISLMWSKLWQWDFNQQIIFLFLNENTHLWGPSFLVKVLSLDHCNCPFQYIFSDTVLTISTTLTVQS